MIKRHSTSFSGDNNDTIMFECFFEHFFMTQFRLTIIPHTLRETLIGEYQIGTKINIETDLFARYIDHILRNRGQKKSMSWDDIDKMQMSY